MTHIPDAVLLTVPECPTHPDDASHDAPDDAPHDAPDDAPWGGGGTCKGVVHDLLRTGKRALDAMHKTGSI